jgi:WD40 repeat protein
MRGWYEKIKWILCCWLIFSNGFSFGQEPVLVLPVGHTSSVTTAVCSTDGKYIVTASWDNTAKIWDATKGKLLSDLRSHTGSLTSAQFRPNRKYIVTTSKDRAAKIWWTSDALMLYELKEHNDAVNISIFSPDGRYIVTASKNYEAIILFKNVFNNLVAKFQRNKI